MLLLLSYNNLNSYFCCLYLWNTLDALYEKSVRINFYKLRPFDVCFCEIGFSSVILTCLLISGDWWRSYFEFVQFMSLWVIWKTGQNCQSMSHNTSNKLILKQNSSPVTVLLIQLTKFCNRFLLHCTDYFQTLYSYLWSNLVNLIHFFLF